MRAWPNGNGRGSKPMLRARFPRPAPSSHRSILRLRRPACERRQPRMADRSSEQPIERSERTHRVAKATFGVLLALFGLWISATFLPALLWAAIIAIAIDPLYARAESRWPRGRRVWLPTIATLAIALLVLAPLTISVVEAVREAPDGSPLAGGCARQRAGRANLGPATAVRRRDFGLVARQSRHAGRHGAAMGPGARIGDGRPIRAGRAQPSSYHRLRLYLARLILPVAGARRVGRPDAGRGRRLFGVSGDRIGAQLVSAKTRNSA